MMDRHAPLSLLSSAPRLLIEWALVLMLGVGTDAWAYPAQSGEPAASPHEQQTPGNPPADARRNETPHPDRDVFGDPLPAGALARLGTVRLRHAGDLGSIAFTPDGKSIVSVGRDGVRVWETAAGKPVWYFGAGVLPRSVSLSADGKRIALACSRAAAGGCIEVWDVAAGKLLHKLGDRHYVLVRFSPDGKRLAALSGASQPDEQTAWQIEIWDAAGRLLHKMIGPKEFVADMRFSADGATLLLGGSGKAISIRNIANGKEVRRLGNLPFDVHTLAVSPRGDRAAFVELWRQRIPSGQIVWGTGPRMALIDLRTGVELRRWNLPTEIGILGILRNPLLDLAWSPDGKRLAAGQWNGPVRIWDAASGKEVRSLGDVRAYSGGLAFSSDGRTLAVGEGGLAIRLIDPQTGADRLPLHGHCGRPRAVALSRDGRTAFTADHEGASIAGTLSPAARGGGITISRTKWRDCSSRPTAARCFRSPSIKHCGPGTLIRADNAGAGTTLTVTGVVRLSPPTGRRSPLPAASEF